MGKSCRRARLAIQELFPIQISLPFPIFKLLPNCIFQCYMPQIWQFYLFFPGQYQVLNLRVGRSHDQVQQRAYLKLVYDTLKVLWQGHFVFWGTNYCWQVRKPNDLLVEHTVLLKEKGTFFLLPPRHSINSRKDQVIDLFEIWPPLISINLFS